MTRVVTLLLLCAATGCGPRSLRITMNAENNSGQSGFAVLTEAGKGVHVEVTLTPADVPSEEPVHVHPGRCGEIGPIQAALTSLKPATATATNFTSVTDLTLTFAEVTDGNHVINAHDSRDFSLYVACGNIK